MEKMRIRKHLRKSLKESEGQSIKTFDKVKAGDTGTVFNGTEVTIISKGPAELFRGYEGYDILEEIAYDEKKTVNSFFPECVLVEQNGREVVYSYGSDGVQVEQDEVRVRQISFDFIDDGVDENDLISRIQDAMDVAEITIVGGPAVGDTSWSKEEYGL
jgi:hypothetical protein